MDRRHLTRPGPPGPIRPRTTPARPARWIPGRHAPGRPCTGATCGQTGAMRIAVTGASGLIGKVLVRSLQVDGHEVVRFVRRPAAAPDEATWDPRRGYVDPAGLVGCGAVVHLAGAGVGDHRWTAAYKREIRDSRVLGTAAIARAVADMAEPPPVLVSGSAVGYYGNTGDRVVDEDAPAGRASCPPSASSGRRPPRRPGTPGSVRSSPAPAWSSPPTAGRGAGCSPSSGPASAVGSATAASTGRTSRCTTRSPPCAT